MWIACLCFEIFFLDFPWNQHFGFALNLANVAFFFFFTAFLQMEQEVFDWLTDLKLACYFDAFKAQGFDMTSIQAITPDDLNCLGVEKTGHRKKLLSEIARLSFADRLPNIKPVSDVFFFHLFWLNFGQLQTRRMAFYFVSQHEAVWPRQLNCLQHSVAKLWLEFGATILVVSIPPKVNVCYIKRMLTEGKCWKCYKGTFLFLIFLWI